jgi:hypothetical protein
MTITDDRMAKTTGTALVQDHIAAFIADVAVIDASRDS